MSLDYFLAFTLPRILTLLMAGGALAVSGALMQALFQNPLASPGVLGITVGSSLFVVIAALFNLIELSPLVLPLAAFIGALVALGALLLLAKDFSSGTLILTGVALSTVFVAAQGALIYTLKDRWQLVTLLTEWEAGSTIHLTWQETHLIAPLFITGLFIAFLHRRELEILALGDEEAMILGIEPKKIRFRLVLASALLVAGALSAVGVIAFFGLIIPHIVRSLKGASHPQFLLWNLLLGGGGLYLLDLLLRTLEVEILTVGSLSAVLGGLFFLYLLSKREAYA